MVIWLSFPTFVIDFEINCSESTIQKNSNMKKVLTHAVLCIAPWVLGACEKELVSEDMIVTDSSLSITTRSVTAEETISFPIAVYVFNSDSKRCVKNEQLATKDTPLAFTLPHGTYDVYAIGGVDESLYTLPSEDVTAESEITLKDGKEHADLMTAHSIVTLEEDEENNLTLNMERQVMQLTDVTIKQIPSGITAVSISLSPSFQSILINGELGKTWTHKYPLVYEGNGCWILPSPTMILLAPEAATITVGLTKSDGTVKNYSYPCPDELKKNYHISITGNYQEDNTVNIVGSVTGTTWAGNKEITFDFGDTETNKEEDDDEEEGLINESAPAAGTIYKDCYVLKVNTTDKADEVLLLYNNDFEINPKEKTEAQVIEEINTILTSLSLNDIAGWRLPDLEEAKLITAKIGIYKIANKNYYYLLDNQLKIFSGSSFLDHQTYSAGERYRPVTILKFRK